MEIRPILSAMFRNKTAPLLVAIQIAISLAILANALYVVQQRYEAATRPSGIASEADVLYMQVRVVQPAMHAEAIAQQQRDADALSAIPGVVSVAWTNQMPMSTSGTTNDFTLDRRQTRRSISMATYLTPGNLVKTLGLQLVEGRDFNAGDVVEFVDEKDDPATTFPRGVIITKAAADLLYPGTAATGKTLYYGSGKDAIEVRIIGVVERLQSTQAQTGPTAEYSVLVPLRISQPLSRFAVRVEPGQRDRVMVEAEGALRKAASVPRVIRAKTVGGDRTQRYRNEHAMAWMLVAVSLLLLLVTASGIVGMTTLRVAQRRKQIGVRRALGARRIDILRYFVMENVLITSGGVVAGVLMGVALNQILVSHLELPKLPVGYVVVGAATLWLLGIAAVLGPAWRAAGISPAIATRSA